MIVQIPFDLLAVIVRTADSSQFPNLCRVSRDIYILAVRELYQNLNLKGVSRDRVASCLRSIVANPGLGAHAYALSIDSNARIDDFADVLAQALTLMPALRDLSVDGLNRCIMKCSGVLDAVAALRQLQRIKLLWSEPLSSLMILLPPLKSLTFDVGAAIQNYQLNTAFERLLLSSATSLHHLRIVGFKISEFLRQYPSLVFNLVSTLDLHFCDTLITEIAQAFPNLRTFSVYPSPVAPLDLLTNPDYFPNMDHAVVGLDDTVFPPYSGSRKRSLKRISLYRSSISTGPRVMLSLLESLDTDSLENVNIPPFGSPKATLEAMMILFNSSPNLQTCTVAVHGRQVDSSRTKSSKTADDFWNLLASSRLVRLRNLSMVLTTDDDLEQLGTAVLPRLATLRLSMPSLLMVKLHHPAGRPWPDVQYRREKTHLGSLAWIMRVIRDSRPQSELPGLD